MDRTTEAVKKFSIQQLVDLAQGLGANKVHEDFEAYSIVDIINKQIDEGNSLESKDYQDFINIFADRTLEVESFDIPLCYERASDSDPVCGKCFLYQNCAEELFNALPNCFGILYDEKLCQDCIVKDHCEVDLEQGTEAQYEVYLYQDVPMLTNILRALARFRNFYQAWPLNSLINKPNRYYDIKIRNLKRKIDYQAWADAFYFSTNVEPEIIINRVPLMLKGERQAIK